MTFFDTKNLDRLSEAQRAQYQEFLKSYPHLASKMDTARQLNTPLAQAIKDGEKSGVPLPSNDDSLDLEAIERQQKESSEPSGKSRPIGEMKIDQKRASMTSLDQEEKIKEQKRQERLQKQIEEEARQQQAGEWESPAWQATPPPPPPKQQARQAPPPPPKPQPKFSPSGKKHPVLQRMRASLGMDELEKSETISIQGVSYTLKRLMREDIAKAVSLATSHTIDQNNLRSYMETAIVSYAVRAIDDTPLADVFEVPQREIKITTGKEGILTSKEREDKGAQLFFEWLIDTPSEFTDSLVVFYEQHFPTVNLMDADNVLSLCPVAGCSYKAIIGRDQTRYCPLHGAPLRSEETLPNPS